MFFHVPFFCPPSNWTWPVRDHFFKQRIRWRNLFCLNLIRPVGSFNQKPDKNIMETWLLCLYLMFTSIMVVRMYENGSLFQLLCLLSLQFFPASIIWLSSVFHSKCQKSAPRTCSRYGMAVLDMWYYSLGYHLSQAGVLLLRWYDLRFSKWLSNAMSNKKITKLAMKIQFSP